MFAEERVQRQRRFPHEQCPVRYLTQAHGGGLAVKFPLSLKYTEAASSLSILLHILNCSISVYCWLIRETCWFEEESTPRNYFIVKCNELWNLAYCKDCSIINRTRFSNYKPAVNSVSVFLHETCLCDSLPILWLKFITIRCLSWQPNNYIQLDLSPCAFSIKTHADCIK